MGWEKDELPGWLWAAIGAAAAVVLFAVGTGIVLALHDRLGPGPDNTVAQVTEPEAPASAPKAHPPKKASPPADGSLAGAPEPGGGVKPPPNPGPDAAGSPPPPRPAWGAPIDPDGDCKFRNLGGKLFIDVPSKYHDLGGNGRTTAPRLLGSVVGNFTAQVRTDAAVAPGNKTSGGPTPFSFHGAGMVFWVDERNFVRLERAALPHRRYLNWQRVVNGTLEDLPHHFIPLEPAGTYLRMERRGRKLFCAFSEDGLRWNPLEPLYMEEMPARAQVGVSAVSTSARPLRATFDHFQLRQGQDDRGQLDTWPIPAEPGAPGALPAER